MRIIQTDSFDEFHWRDAQAQSKGLQDAIKDARNNGDSGYADLVADVFQLLHQPAPQWRTTKQLSMHEHVLRELTDTREFQELRALSENDLFNATMGTDILARRLKPKMKNEIAKRLEDEHEAIHKAERAKTLQDTIAEAIANDPAMANDPQIRELAEQAAKLLEEADVILIIEIDVAGVEEAVAELRREVRNAVPEAVEQIEEMDSIREMMGEGGKQTLEAKMALADRIKRSPKLSEVMELAGRLRRIARAKRANVIKTLRQEIVGITIGNDVERAIPSELALLKRTETKPIFAKKFLEGQLLQYDMAGKEELGRGPFVMLIDSTGSMRGDKEVWAKAVMMAVLAVAEDEKRDVYLGHFGGAGQLMTYEFPYRSDPRTVTRERIMECIEYFMNASSTDLQTPLDWAADQIERGSQRFKDADIIILSDAEAEFESAWLTNWSKRRLAIDFHSYGVLIGIRSSMNVMKKAVENVAYITDLTQDDNVLDMLFAHE